MAVTCSEIILQETLDQKEIKALDISWGGLYVEIVAYELDISSKC
jgi:hypothetical protein